MDKASCGYAYVFDFGWAIDAPDDVHIAALVEGDLLFVIECQIGNDYRGSERSAAVRRALIFDATLIASSYHSNVVARIHDRELPEHKARRGRRKGCPSINGSGE
jgi:hypothetical protein